MKCIVPPDSAARTRSPRRHAAGLTLASALAVISLGGPAAAQHRAGEPLDATRAKTVNFTPAAEGGGPLISPPLSVLPSYTPGPAAALVGVNLLGGGYTSENQMFADAMRTALRWRDPNNLYGGALVPTDANGWPTADAGIFVVDGTLTYNWNFSDGVRNQRGPEMGGVWKLSSSAPTPPGCSSSRRRHVPERRA
jgi:hypothetical protein